jgi:hypothetical protein
MNHNLLYLFFMRINTMVESTLNESIESTGRNEEKRIRAEIIKAVIPRWTINEEKLKKEREKGKLADTLKERLAILKGEISPNDVTAAQLNSMLNPSKKGSPITFSGITPEIE